MSELIVEGQESKKDEGQDQATFEVPEAKESPKEDNTLTMEEAQGRGWSQEEIEIAKETGIIKKEEEGEEAKKESKSQPEPKKEKESKKEEKKEEEPKKSGQSIDDFLLSAEEEKQLAEAIDRNPDASKKLKNVAANYWGRKHATARAQAAEAERERLRKENDDLKSRLDKIEDRITKTGEGEDDEDDDRPLTKKEMLALMKDMRSEEENTKRKQQEETERETRKINEALKIQEEHAKNIYSDYADVVRAGEKLVKRDPNSGQFESEINITTLPEGPRKKAMMLIKQIRDSAMKAYDMSVDDYTVADMSYDLGKLALEYGVKSKADSEKVLDGQRSERTTGGLTPEDEERIRKNKSRASSSAQVSGSGGRRMLSVDEVTIEDLNRMDTKTFNDFQAKYPDKVEELMRG